MILYEKRKVRWHRYMGTPNGRDHVYMNAFQWTRYGDTRHWYRLWTKVRYGWLVLGWICSRRGHDYQEQFLTTDYRLSACSRCGKYRGAQRITPYPERRSR